MFEGCSSLSSLPDISKWNTNNVTNIIGMFNRCSSLSSLDDISKWNTNNVMRLPNSFEFNKIKNFYECPNMILSIDIKTKIKIIHSWNLIL